MQSSSTPTPGMDGMEQPSTTQPSRRERMELMRGNLKEKFTTRSGLIGDYDYAWLCLPRIPGLSKKRNPPPFFGLDEKIPLVIAIVTGFQHSLAMIGGLITPPIIFAGELNLDSTLSSYLISASLIASGILSAVQMSGIPFTIPFVKRRFQLGSGLLTVVGTSFATLSTASAIFDSLYLNGICPTVGGVKQACPEGYGYLLGTAIVCSLLEMFMSFLPIRVLKKIFPPIVTGTVVLFIGASLVGSSGITSWMGGSGTCMTDRLAGTPSLCPGNHAYYWGAPAYIGLGFLSFTIIILTEFFGSPFLRNASIVVGLALGTLIAGVIGYTDGSSISAAPSITFLWVHTFPLKVYGPAVLPLMAVYISLAMEAIGDTTASAEVSRVQVEGEIFDRRIQGAVLADGMNGLLSGLFTVTPLSVFAQNNGVIALTRTANRTAGYFCCGFLLLYGILGKISGVFLSIPNSILGGVTTFLFSSVVVSGLKVLSYVRYTRRDRFILAAAMSFGVGTLLQPDWFAFLLVYNGTNNALRGFYSAIIIILSTPFLISALVGIVLNLLLPHEEDLAPPRPRPEHLGPTSNGSSSPTTDNEKNYDIDSPLHNKGDAEPPGINEGQTLKGVEAV